jgi:hypothetical protein
MPIGAGLEESGPHYTKSCTVLSICGGIARLPHELLLITQMKNFIDKGEDGA